MAVCLTPCVLSHLSGSWVLKGKGSEVVGHVPKEIICSVFDISTACML